MTGVFRVQVLDPAAAPAFAHMTYTAERPLLEATTPDGFALGLWQDETPVGLALARLAPEAAELISLFIARALWGQTLGGQLLGVMEDELRARGVTRIGESHSTEGACLAAWERLLARRGWSPPQLTLVQAELPAAKIAQAPWVLANHLPAGHEVFPWAELTEAERQTLMLAEGEVPPALWPFQVWTTPLAAPSSLGVRVQGEVVGWILTHQVQPHIVRCSIEFVRPRWRTPAVSFGLMAEMIRRAGAPPNGVRFLSFAVSRENEPMLRLARRRLLPYASSHHELRSSGKEL